MTRVTTRLFWCLLATVSVAVTTPHAEAFEWGPSDEEIQKYRKSWNPLSNGPMFISGVDVHPKGQFTAHPFIFSQITEKKFGNDLTVNRTASSTHVYQIAPVVTMAYGLTNNLEFNVGLSTSTFWARDSTQFNQGQGGPVTTDTGLGDTQLYLKHRLMVQDPDTWRPTITTFNMIVLPTSQWITGTERPPGGFAPLGRLPAARFGALTWTEGVMFRKNFSPSASAAASSIPTTCLEAAQDKIPTPPTSSTPG